MARLSKEAAYIALMYARVVSSVSSIHCTGIVYGCNHNFASIIVFDWQHHFKKNASTPLERIPPEWRAISEVKVLFYQGVAGKYIAITIFLFTLVIKRLSYFSDEWLSTETMAGINTPACKLWIRSKYSLLYANGTHRLKMFCFFCFPRGTCPFWHSLRRFV